MITYYLSGPMRGLPQHNYPVFHEVEEALAAWLANDEYQGTLHEVGGFEILNPARNFGGDTQRQTTEYMQLDLELVLRSDVIVLLPGWEKSEGADRETKLAEWSGKRFMTALPQTDGTWFFYELRDGLPAKHLSPRADALFEAQALITGDRNNAYGPPTQDFQRAAGILNAMGYQGQGGRPIESHDIALMVMAVKMSRLVWTPGKRDSWVDIAGYAGCGYECAVEEEEAF